MPTHRRAFLKTTTAGFVSSAMLPGMVSATADEATKPQSSLIAAARYLGPQFLQNDVNVTGADGATATPLPSGESLWVFGDTIEGPFETVHGLDLTNYRSNTAAIVPKQSAADGVKNFRFLATADRQRPRQLIPFAPHENPSEHRVWGIHGACVGPRIYLFYHRISLLKGVDVFVNFRLDGMGIARAELADLEFTRLAAPDSTLEFWKGDAPTFGVWVQAIDDRLYLWGNLMTGAFLARTRPDAIEDFANYEYLVSAPTLASPTAPVEWSKEFKPTAPLFDSAPNEMSASFNAHLGRFIAIHSLHREPKIVLRTAPAITGPWTAPQFIYEPTNANPGDLIYAAKEHPELASENGRVLYVTYVNSRTYAPELVELTLR